MSHSPNALIHSKSPYLLQHAYNPVQWFPWGPEALERSQSDNKPILVSIGYSACHWCHVMERESFEDEETAALMNEGFVCIKIDREERPDLDNIYMDAVQAMGLQGGWPLNVFLMPNQKPFYGGTYFPNKNWKGLLKNIKEAFAKHHDQLAESAEGFGRSLSINEKEKYGLSDGELDVSKDEMSKIITQLENKFDPEWGGMNRVPKFPMPSIWHLVMDYALAKDDQGLLEKVFFTLKKIGMGGIYDQLRGGFSRYSVDGEWFAPHFEKMLYDNGQLMALYAKAYQVSNDPFYEEKLTETLQWLEAEMLQEEGGFYAAQDADSEGVEGKFYTWIHAELKSILGNDQDWFFELYNIKETGNWEDGVNILFQTQDLNVVAKNHGLNETQLKNQLKTVKSKLLDIRNKRIFPGLDDKVISGWNGLMLSGLSQAYLATQNPLALNMARNNATFLKEKMLLQGILYRSYKEGQTYTPAFLEDYAAVIQGWISYYQVSLEEKWLLEAKKLMEKAIEDFWDDQDGLFYYNNPKAEKLIANKKEIFDNVIPASNSMMARNLHQLGIYFYEDSYMEKARSMVASLQPLLVKEPGFLTHWANAYLEHLLPAAEVGIVGKGALEKAKSMTMKYTPNSLVAASESSDSQLPLLQGKTADSDGNALIYVCFNRTCMRPVSEVDAAFSQFPKLS
ncbi:thioredoxin domain-containing protein [Pararhodonellum marinum]|uniref:thioredoxin domain-containing protein n=1 Tax=Pararhodonellum marinum TaxID=2755358 RepID=UPI00188EEF85|nr:thioredoxin domain-containing protein [Pararhodonellum marinum]